MTNSHTCFSCNSTIDSSIWYAFQGPFQLLQKARNVGLPAGEGTDPLEAPVQLPYNRRRCLLLAETAVNGLILDGFMTP